MSVRMNLKETHFPRRFCHCIDYYVHPILISVYHTQTIHLALRLTMCRPIPWEYSEEVVVSLEESHLSLDDTTGPAWLEKLDTLV